MQERTHDAELADAWSTQPLTDAHNYTVQLVHMCEDYLECMCRLVDDDCYAPVWGLLPLGRALLEAAGRAHHLAEPGVTARDRVERYINEDLFALEQVGNLPAAARGNEELARRRRDNFESAARNGFERKRHADPAEAARGRLAEPPQLGRGRLGDLACVRELFKDTPDLAPTVYRWFAAGAHATMWEVVKPFTHLEHSDVTGHTRVLLARDPVELFQLMNTGLFGYLGAANAVLELHGWADQTWWRSAHNSLKLAGMVGEQIRRGTVPPDQWPSEAS